MTLADTLSPDYRSPYRASDSALDARARDSVGREGEIRLAIHDASRIEWSFAVPLPVGGERGEGGGGGEAGDGARSLPYTLTAELLVPSHTFVPHSPWERLQIYTRLDGGGARSGDRYLPSVDAIRRETVARASALGDTGRLFARHCRLAGSLFAMAPHSDLEDCLREALDTARQLAAEGRREEAEEPADLRRERLLADEWISTRYIELLAGSERSLGAVLESRSPHLGEMEPAIERLQDEVADALAAEMGYREGRGHLRVDERDGPEALERYLDRASGLKKHFQEVLFLEMDHAKPAETIQLWARVVATLLAGTLAFFLQLELTRHATSSSEVGSGLTALAVVAGLSYAARDRFKESGREWLAGKVARLYAQRITTWRLPPHRSPQRARGRGVVAVARESVEESRVRLAGPLTRESGYDGPSAMTGAVTSVKYVQRALVRPQPSLRAEGSSRVKLVFRYDLSPLFARMDDPVKKLPVLEPGSRRVRFTDAPRCYRMQVRLTLNVDGRRHTEHQTVVLSKRGLERLEEIGAPQME